MSHLTLVTLQWVISVGAITGTWLIGRRVTNGWLLAAIVSTLGIIYNLVTRQYGFLLCQVPMLVIDVKNYREWRAESRNLVK